MFLVAIIVCACEEKVEAPDDKFDLSGINFDGLNLDLKTTYSLKEKSLEEIAALISKELFEDGLGSSANLDEISPDFQGADLLIDPVSEIVIIEPIEGTAPEGTDDEKCGGEDGDGWTSHGKCVSQSCVETKLTQAAISRADDLDTGECLDLRVVKKSLYARVCSRIKTCD